MASRTKNRWLLLLMVSSVVLLLLFQAFWLREVYQEQRDWLAEQTDNLFIRTVRQMQDELTQQMISATLAELKSDTSVAFITMEPSIEVDHEHLFGVGQHDLSLDSGTFSTVVIKTSDSLQVDWKAQKEEIRQSSIVRFSRKQKIDPVVPKFLQKMILSISLEDSSHNEIFQLGTDSLEIDSLYQQYAQALDGSGIAIGFQLHRLAEEKSPPALSADLHTSHILADIPEKHLYFASFANTRGFLFAKIAPQILFSLLLVSLTMLSFVMVYRNLKKQQRLTALKNDLISNITHELKTPITTVGVAIEALSNFNALRDPERTKEYLDISKNELKRLSILVDKVLKTALFGEEEMELKLEVLDLQELISEILSSMKLQFEKFAAKIQFRADGRSFELEGDRIHLTSVIYNLLDNALKYGSNTPSIAIELEQDRPNRQLQLKVIDNGIGIPAEFKDRIFEKFFRVPTGDRHDIKGHGLGLNYVANVIRRHRGKISVESEPGKGSMFTIKLPSDHGTD